VRRNGLSDRIRVQAGSLERALAVDPLPQLLLANILSRVLLELLRSGLARSVSPGGHLILAGILEAQARAVASLAEQDGLRLQTTASQGEWRALVLEREAPPSQGAPRVLTDKSGGEP
jgi:ribosomal protein L11 methylase PrmA